MKPALLKSFVLLTGSLHAAHAALDPNKTLSIGIILFPGFQPIDVVGPLDVFAGASRHQNMTISFLWKTPGPVPSVGPPRLYPPPGSTRRLYPIPSMSLVATHSFATAPDLDILLVPGGIGNRFLNDTGDTSMEDFIASRYPSLKYLLSVCTGAATLAKSGVLNGRRATTNKAAWEWATSFGGGKVKWTATARWVVDGNVWTSSGISAGIDMTYAFVKELIGEKVAGEVINGMEYTPHLDHNWDPYSVVFNVEGADRTRRLGDCVGPVGFEFDCGK